ncbi:MAG: nitroreductase family protein [Planctomycetes bacterium]|nr:nitroreductase family protein [Planctomycetota bacterium]
MDVRDAIRQRRSVRRFDRDRPVPRELLLEVLDAGRWAPSSCNLQTWDFVVAEDEDLRRELAREVRSLLLAPVGVFVVYDRELAREGHGNIQSAAACIMNMLLAATARGLASLWVNALGERARVRELLGVPEEHEVLALVCLGWPAGSEPPPVPERRPLDEVIHWNRFRAGQGALPRSPDPDDWTLAQIGSYVRRKLQSGTRFDKPDPAFFEPVMEAVRAHLGAGEQAFRLLDVLPGPGLFSEALRKAYPRAALAVMESSAASHFFCERRCGAPLGFVPFPQSAGAKIAASCAQADAAAPSRESGGLAVVPSVLPAPSVAAGEFDAATVLFRLEGVPRGLRLQLLQEAAARVRPGGRVLIAYTSRRSWHLPAYALRRRLGRDTVEYAPAPDGNIIGPYEPLAPGAVRELARACGLVEVGETRLQALPDFRAIGPRLRSAGLGVRLLARLAAIVATLLRPAAGLLQPLARIRILCLKRA